MGDKMKLDAARSMWQAHVTQLESYLDQPRADSGARGFFFQRHHVEGLKTLLDAIRPRNYPEEKPDKEGVYLCQYHTKLEDYYELSEWSSDSFWRLMIFDHKINRVYHGDPVTWFLIPEVL